MERQDLSWDAATNDGYLLKAQSETFDFLHQLIAMLERLVLQNPPYSRLDPPAELRGKPGHPVILLASEGDTLGRLHTEINELEDLLSEGREPTELGEYGLITQHLGRRSFYNGFLDKRRTVPLLQKSSPDVIRFLEKVPKFGDYVKRENHAHFGIHYHYLNSSKKRSDTVLCLKAPAPWPLFAEKHAERSAHFAARPRGWSEDRRRAVYGIISSEKKRFKGSDFRSPSKGSALVWQEDAALLRQTKQQGLEIVLTDQKVLLLD
jgi:hypothetical protein